MASIGPALDVPEGRPNRRFIAVATLVAVAVVLAVAALLIGVWLVRETVVWLLRIWQAADELPFYRVRGRPEDEALCPLLIHQVA